jgi:hypothetical protein
MIEQQAIPFAAFQEKRQAVNCSCHCSKQIGTIINSQPNLWLLEFFVSPEITLRFLKITSAFNPEGEETITFNRLTAFCNSPDAE